MGRGLKSNLLLMLSCLVAFTIGLAALPTGVSAWKLPDTDLNTCYDGTVEIPCPKPWEDYYGQDAQYSINPQSFTKLDANGNDLDDGASTWVMVRDNNTGLVWEGKTDDGGIHDWDNTYDWYHAQDTFITQLNSAQFGGNSDWRLPTIQELSTIVRVGGWPLAIDNDYFPLTRHPFYWSATPCMLVSESAWYGNTDFGYVFAGGKPQGHYVRAVRGGEPTGSFEDNGDGTVTDTVTGLMWQQHTEASSDWKTALNLCEGLTLAGYEDWRLPNWKELQTLVDYGRATSPRIDEDVFPDTQSGLLLGRQLRFFRNTTGGAWRVDFDSGRIDDYYSTAISYAVRAVRGGLGDLAVRPGGGVAGGGNFSQNYRKLWQWIRCYSRDGQCDF